MTCQQRIQVLEDSVKALEEHLQVLEAMPGSDTDPSIIAAVAQTQAALTSARTQLANEKAACDGTSDDRLPANLSSAVRTAERGMRASSASHRKALLAASKEIRRHSQSMVKALGGGKRAVTAVGKPKKAVGKKPAKKMGKVPTT